MAEMTNEYENMCINRFLRGAADGALTAWVGFASAVTNAESGVIAANITEVPLTGGTDYGRVTCGFSASTTGTTNNAGDINFTESTSGYPAAITHVIVFSTQTAGVALLIKALGSSKSIGAGDTPKIAQNQLVVTFD